MSQKKITHTVCVIHVRFSEKHWASWSNSFLFLCSDLSFYRKGGLTQRSGSRGSELLQGSSTVRQCCWWPTATKMDFLQRSRTVGPVIWRNVWAGILPHGAASCPQNMATVFHTGWRVAGVYLWNNSTRGVSSRLLEPAKASCDLQAAVDGKGLLCDVCVGMNQESYTITCVGSQNKVTVSGCDGGHHLTRHASWRPVRMLADWPWTPRDVFLEIKRTMRGLQAGAVCFVTWFHCRQETSSLLFSHHSSTTEGAGALVNLKHVCLDNRFISLCVRTIRQSQSNIQTSTTKSSVITNTQKLYTNDLEPKPLVI